MPALTAAELTTLRSQVPHTAKVDWYLALAPYGDPTFTAQVNDAAIAKGERDIVYNNDTGENTVEAGMTLWVGSAAGLYDVGKIRIRDIDTGTNTITVAENDDIEWADDLYLTCPGAYGFRELWAIYPRITEAGGVVTFYEDYDEAYNDPVDDVLPPKANAGPPVCEFIDATDGYAEVAFTGDESFTTEVGAGIASYLWDFADGTLVSGNIHSAGTCLNPNTVRFTTPGFRYVSLTVTDNTAQARTGTVYVPVWIFNRTTQAPLMVESQSQSGDPEWKLSVKAFSTEGTAQDIFYNYPDGALCVLFTETEYPNGGNPPGGFCYRSNIRYVGWLDAESLSFDYDSGTVTFNAISHDLRLKSLPGFAYTLEDSNAPDDWYEVEDLNIDRALHAHLERKSTTNQVCHVERLDEATRTIAVQGFPDASIYDQAQEHLLKDAMTTMLSDRQGILRVRRDPQFMDAVDRNAVAVVCSLTVDDILNDIDESRKHQYELGYVRLGGFAYETPLLAEAPGVAPSQSEAATYTEGFLVEDQAEMNLWAGLWWEKENNDYKQVPIEMQGYWPVFDPALQEYIRLTATDPLGRVVFINQRFIVRRVTFGDLVGDGTATTSLVLEKETDILEGETVTIPVPPPPESPPPPPEIPAITIPTPTVAIVHNRAKIYSTADFDALNPTWTDITGAIVGVIFAAEVDHFDGVGAWALTGTDNVDSNDQSNTVGLWHTPDVTIGAPVWTLVFTQKDGYDNRHAYPTYDGNAGCTGADAQPTWGQLRSLVPTESGVCVIAEARYHGLTCFIYDMTDIFKVDSAGAFESLYAQQMMCYGPRWELECNQCLQSENCYKGTHYTQYAQYVNQDEHRGCHQLYFGPSGYGYLAPAGMYHFRDHDEYCNNSVCGACACAGCRNCRPWPTHPDTDPAFGGACQGYRRGSRHVITQDGKWFGQTDLDSLGTYGGVYNSSDGELDNNLWLNYAFCNITSHSDSYYYCKQIQATVARANELYINGAASGVTSDLLFGGNGAGYSAGVIGHIRAIWDDDDTVVLVRKDEPVAAQPNKYSVWTYDPTNGLQNKTGNLSGITWYGTGRGLPPGIGWNYRWDNVGFSAFGVPLR